MIEHTDVDEPQGIAQPVCNELIRGAGLRDACRVVVRDNRYLPFQHIPDRPIVRRIREKLEINSVSRSTI